MVTFTSITVPLPLCNSSPLGQSTPQKIWKKEPMVDPLAAGQGSRAIPVVPEVTGADEVWDAVGVDVGVLPVENVVDPCNGAVDDDVDAVIDEALHIVRSQKGAYLLPFLSLLWPFVNEQKE